MNVTVRPDDQRSIYLTALGRNITICTYHTSIQNINYANHLLNKSDTKCMFNYSICKTYYTGGKVSHKCKVNSSCVLIITPRG